MYEMKPGFNRTRTCIHKTNAQAHVQIANRICLEGSKIENKDKKNKIKTSLIFACW